MLVRILISILFLMLLQGCATQMEEPDLDATGDETSVDSGEKRSFDPCKLNNKLPVCNQNQ